MAAPLLEFSHLTPDERIKLAVQLWDSLEDAVVGPTDERIVELRARRAALETDPDPGDRWQAVVDEIGERGR